jgi:ligand-binding sensor domain-containing protein
VENTFDDMMSTIKMTFHQRKENSKLFQTRSLLLLSILISCNGQNNSSRKLSELNDSINKTGGQPRIIKTRGTDEYDNVNCGLEDKSGNIWFGTSGEGVYRYNGKLHPVERAGFTNFTEKDGLQSNNVCNMLEDTAGNIWFGSNGEVSNSGIVSYYDGKTFTKFRIPPAPYGYSHRPNFPNDNPFSTYVSPLAQDKAGNIWFGTNYSGVYRYEGKSKSASQENFINFLPGEVVDCMLEDKNGNLWFGCWAGSGSGGVYRFDGGRANHPCFKNTCKHNLRIQQDLMEHNRELAKSFTHFISEDGLEDNLISGISEDRAGNILFVTRDHGVCSYDGKNFTRFSEKLGLPNTNIRCMLEDKSGNIWFGTDGKRADGNGVYRYNGKFLSAGQAGFTNFTMKEGLPNNNVFTILEDKTGNIWFGTRNVGLCRYDGKSLADFTGNNP